MKNLFTTLLLGISALNAWAQVIYVDSSATGMNNGTSWADAYSDLQNALAHTSAGEIWVAKGTYYPTADTANRDTSFVLKNGVALYGGFNGSETQRSQRDWSANPTILSGDIDRNDLASPADTTTDIAGGNSLHVISNPSGTDTTAVIDGFVITAGWANTPYDSLNMGAGMFNNGENQGTCSPKVEHCSFTGNYSASFGGAMGNSARRGGRSFPVVRACHFRNNVAALGGGAAMYSSLFGGESGGPLEDCVFEQNYSPSTGGALRLESSDSGRVALYCQNSDFRANRSGDPGGAVYSEGTLGSLDNSGFSYCTFTTNQADGDGGALFFAAASQSQSRVHIDSCRFEGNFSAANGGAVLQAGDWGSVRGTLSRCIFLNNSCNLIGGAVSNISINGGLLKAHITGCRFENNQSGLSGPSNLLVAGALYSSGANGGLDSSQIRKCEFRTNSSRFGGAVFLNGASGRAFARMDSCLLQGNQALGSGGALFIQGFRGESFTQVTHCDFQGNEAQDAAGAIYLSGTDGPDGNLIAHCLFSGNQCNTIGGAIYNSSTAGGLHTRILDCAFLSNVSGISGNSWELVAGAVYSSGSQGGSDSSVIRRCRFEANISSAAGALFLNAARGENYATIDSCQFVQNEASNLGGAIYCQASEGIMRTVFTRCEISGNKAVSLGGGVYLTSSSGGDAHTQFSRCVFEGNEAIEGGGVFARAASSGTYRMSIRQVKFLRNHGQNMGGAISAQALSLGNISAGITNTLFSGNSSANQAAGIGLQGNGGSATARIENSTFYHNLANTANGSVILGELFNSGVAQSVNINNVFQDYGPGQPVWPILQHTVSHSFVENGYPGGTNLSLQDGDPAFADPDGPDGQAGTSDDDLSLLPQSILIDAGDTALVQIPAVLDLAGNPRFQLGNIDIGAYESDTLLNTTAVELPENSAVLEVWPNPAKDFLWVKADFNGFQPVELHLLDLNGKRLRSKRVFPGENTFVDLIGLPSGRYFLELQAPSGRCTQALIVK